MQNFNLKDFIQIQANALEQAGVAFGHGTDNAWDEAAWLVLWAFGLPLDFDIDFASSSIKSPEENVFFLAFGITDSDVINKAKEKASEIVETRIKTRKPAAYLTQEAHLQGIAFYIDERSIVPRSLIAELLAEGGFDDWLSDSTHEVLDMCTGNGSLAILAAMSYPDVKVTGTDLSTDALAVASINVKKYQLENRITLLAADMWTSLALKDKTFDLILCNPPYVNSDSMSKLPLEYLAEPNLALAGGTDGMDFIRKFLKKAPVFMTKNAVVVLEIGNERTHFETTFGALEVVWLYTTAGIDQVLIVTRDALLDFYA